MTKQNNYLYSVSEVFTSISGEGTNAGKVATFIRLAGCNLAEKGTPCQFCDTSYAWKKEAPEMTFGEILKLCQEHKTKYLVLTGGEPLYQPYVKELITSLWAQGYFVEVETNGSLPLWATALCRWSMDIKTPGSGVSDENNYFNLDKLTPYDQLKFVVCDAQDLVFCDSIIQDVLDLGSQHWPTVIVQASWGLFPLSDLAAWIIGEKDKFPELDIRLGSQLQKVIFGASTRGV